MNTICPWCDAEIVWDEETGPEDSCPHCLNDLGDYRSVSLDGIADDEEVIDEHNEDEMPHVVKMETSTELLEYARSVLVEQEEWLLCGHCEEAMLHIGTQTVETALFKPRKVKGKVVLQPPFSYEVFVCPNCDKLEQVLSLTDKHKWAAQVKDGR
jgi:hypothetical protein